MKRKAFCLVVLCVQLLMIYAVNLCAQSSIASRKPQKEIAVTVDDLPLNGPSIELKKLQAMTDKILTGIKKYQIPVVGFVNESLLYSPGEADARIALLKHWSEVTSVELGNHTFSHLGFRDHSLIEYEDDFIRGESITKILMQQKGRKIRYFRHPFLQMGNTPELEKSFEDFIGQRGYKIAPVTIDSMDWMFLAAYQKAQKAGDAKAAKEISNEYIKFAGMRIDFSEKASAELFGRPIKHILLLHANELNADNFDALVKVLTDRGYQFITLEEALKDPVYKFPDKYASTSDWLSHWAFSKQKKLDYPMPPQHIQNIFNGNQK